MDWLRVHELSVQFMGPNPFKPLIAPELAHHKAVEQVKREEWEKDGLDLFSEEGTEDGRH